MKDIIENANDDAWFELGLAIVELAVRDYIDFYRATHNEKNIKRERKILRAMKRSKDIPSKDIDFVRQMDYMRREIPKIKKFMKSELAVIYTNGKVNLKLLMNKAEETVLSA